MFYLISLQKDINLYPKDIKDKDKDIRTLISIKLRDLENKIIGNYGYVISVIKFNIISKGKIDNETGIINYKIMYRSLFFKLIKDEIIDAIPIYINEHGFFCKIGPSRIFISQHMMGGWKYNSDEVIYELKNDKKIEIIKIGKIIRLKILAAKINSNEINPLAELYAVN